MIRFGNPSGEQVLGELKQGAELRIEYDRQRLTACRRLGQGVPLDELEVHVAFHPRGSCTAALVERERDPAEPAQVGTLPVTVTIPRDAETVQLWFRAFLPAGPWGDGCEAWDNNSGRNYRFEVLPDGPEQPVRYRDGAEVAPQLVRQLRHQVVKRRRPFAATAGHQLETTLRLEVWVDNLAYQKEVWVDVHLFDASGRLVSARTLPLEHVGPGEHGGDVFVLDRVIHEGTGGVGGSVWLEADLRTAQYRLYYHAAGRLCSDGTLHQASLRPDDEARQAQPTGPAPVRG